MAALCMFGAVIGPLAFASDQVVEAETETPMTLAEEVDFYRSTCIAPFFEGMDEGEVLASLAASDSGEALLTRLSKGAPQNWSSLADTQLPIERRLEVALNLLGMAVSHGNPSEKRVAAAYSVQYFPIPQTELCRKPDGLSDYVEGHDFWTRHDSEE